MHNPAAETASVSAAASLQPLLQVDRVSLQYRSATAVVPASERALGASGAPSSTTRR